MLTESCGVPGTALGTTETARGETETPAVRASSLGNGLRQLMDIRSAVFGPLYIRSLAY